MERIARAFFFASSVVVFALPTAASAVAAPSCVISTPPGNVYVGYPAALVWYTENADKAFLNYGIGQVQVPSGHLDVYPGQTTMYTMQVTNAAGSRTCSVIVKVIQTPSNLLMYGTPTYAPILFTPVTYVSTFPIGGNAYRFDPRYADSYEEWYDDYPSRTYNRKYDFWSDFTAGPSTGPSLFQQYSGGNLPYGTAYTEDIATQLPGGAARTMQQECVAGIGCRVTGMGYAWDITDDQRAPDNSAEKNSAIATDPGTTNNTDATEAARIKAISARAGPIYDDRDIDVSPQWNPKLDPKYNKDPYENGQDGTYRSITQPDVQQVSDRLDGGNQTVYPSTQNTGDCGYWGCSQEDQLYLQQNSYGVQDNQYLQDLYPDGQMPTSYPEEYQAYYTQGTYYAESGYIRELDTPPQETLEI